MLFKELSKASVSKMKGEARPLRVKRPQKQALVAPCLTHPKILIQT